MTIVMIARSDSRSVHTHCTRNSSMLCFGDDIRDRQLERSTYSVIKCTKANSCVERFMLPVLNVVGGRDIALLFLEDATSLEGLCMPNCVLTYPVTATTRVAACW